MSFLVAIFLLATFALLTVVAAQTIARRRLTAEHLRVSKLLEASEATLRERQVALVQSAERERPAEESERALLQAPELRNQTSEATDEKPPQGPDRNAELERLSRAIEDLNQELAERVRRETELCSVTSAKEARISELIELAATHERREAELIRDLSALRSQTEQGAVREQRLFAELDKARAAATDAGRAQRLAEEEARQARTAKESFSAEVRLLRRELDELREQLRNAQEPSEAAKPIVEEKKPARVVRVTAWACTTCGTVAGDKVQDCCLRAGLTDLPHERTAHTAGPPRQERH